MNLEVIPERVGKAIRTGAGGPLLEAKRILGDRMQWLGMPVRAKLSDVVTCWGLDGCRENATYAEILEASGLTAGVVSNADDQLVEFCSSFIGRDWRGPTKSELVAFMRTVEGYESLERAKGKVSRAIHNRLLVHSVPCDDDARIFHYKPGPRG